MSSPVTDQGAEITEDVPKLIAPDLVDIDSSGTPRLKAGRCIQCGAQSFPAAVVCTSCLSENIETLSIDGDGELYAFSVVHQAPRGWVVPYALGYVDLPGGLRILGHIDADFPALRSGLPVKLAVGSVREDADEEGTHSYVFRPVE